MKNNRVISASEIGFYTFCPRAWALQQLEYPPDNQWRLEEGKQMHEEKGREELKENEKNLKAIEKQDRKINFLTVLAIIILFVMISLIIRMVLA